MNKRNRYGPNFYILRGKLAVPVRDALEWAASWEDNRRIVQQTEFQNAAPWIVADRERHRDAERRRRDLGLEPMLMNEIDYERAAAVILVSTVFLGLDHGFGGAPLIFETMVFNGPLHDEMDRYGSWDEAEKGHGQICERVRVALVERANADTKQ